MVAIYFSMSSYTVSREFTPVLVEFYKKLKETLTYSIILVVSPIQSTLPHPLNIRGSVEEFNMKDGCVSSCFLPTPSMKLHVTPWIVPSMKPRAVIHTLFFFFDVQIIIIIIILGFYFIFFDN